MTLQAAVGIAQALDGREAGLQAAHQALNHLGAGTPGLGILIASHQFQAREVATGVASLLSDVPLIGFSSPAGLTNSGQHTNSVVLALLKGDFEAEAHWLPSYAQSGRETAAQLMQLASAHKDNKAALLFADGFNGDAEQLCSAIPNGLFPIVGGLSSGDLHTGNTFQMAGNQTGTGSLSAAFLRGTLRVGVGYAHGWDPVGSQFRVTRFARFLAPDFGWTSGFGDIRGTFRLSRARLGFPATELSCAFISAGRGAGGRVGGAGSHSCGSRRQFPNERQYPRWN